jgi:hypothetical protein
MKKSEELVESYLNGNISWVRSQLGGNRRLICAAIAVLQAVKPEETATFLRLMGR